MAVHDVRQRCKKARAALRLARPALGDAFARENTRFRDAARLISDLRDAEAVVEAAQRLAASEAGTAQEAALHRAVEAMRGQRSVAATHGELREGLDQAAAQLVAARERMAALPVRGDGFDIIAGGLQRTYRDARRDMRIARKAAGAGLGPRATEALHAWRKRIKDHWYQMRMLRGLWPAAIEARMAELQRLSDLLGADHDLATLSAVLDREPEGPDVAAIEPLLREQREYLVAAAWPLGARLLAEKPGAFVDRVRRLWGADAEMGGC